VSLGEIHPAALPEGQEPAIRACRALRATQQDRAKRRSQLRTQPARHKCGARSWQRRPRRTSRLLAQQPRRARERDHPASRAGVPWATEHQVNTLVIGDGRDVAEGKRLSTQRQHKMGGWSPGRQRQDSPYTSAAAGIPVPSSKNPRPARPVPRA